MYVVMEQSSNIIIILIIIILIIKYFIPRPREPSAGRTGLYRGEVAARLLLLRLGLGKLELDEMEQSSNIIILILIIIIIKYFIPRPREPSAGRKGCSDSQDSQDKTRQQQSIE